MNTYTAKSQGNFINLIHVTEFNGIVSSNRERRFLGNDISALRAYCHNYDIKEVVMDDLAEEHQRVLSAALAPKTVAPMEDDGFWGLVQRVQWPQDVDRGRRILVNQLGTIERAEAFRDTYTHKYNEVSKALDSVEDDIPFLGDDSYSDLVAHVIGLGREIFERETSNPQLLVKRAELYDYKESFSYCVPELSDMLPSAQLEQDHQRMRDRAARACANEVRDAVEDILHKHLERCPGMRYSPIKHEVESAVRTTLHNIFEKGEGEDDA